TWSSLNLSGRLVYVSASYTQSNLLMNVQVLDLVTGNLTTIFQTPPKGWVDYASVSPDGTTIAMSYSAPPGANLGGQETIYTLPLDGSSAPQIVVTPSSASDQYFQPVWSPDGKYVYFVRVTSSQDGQSVYQVMRMAYPNGQPEKLADQAYWPRLSSDGSRLVYITLDPVTGLNKIYVANADGSSAYQVQMSGSWTPDIVDAPLFSPDGQSLIISAPIPPQSNQPSWLDKLFGITIAYAHTIPSDWWSVPVQGGTLTRLTRLGTVSLYGSFSPDQKMIASFSGEGIFVMNPDGAGVTTIIGDTGGVAGTVNWIQ
ncbi:MAG TPA: hypothetical protein VMT73_14420, partial [Anaerolineales bacterium]|nr:hypothetical protein [Anaerolineales bacterium]